MRRDYMRIAFLGLVSFSTAWASIASSGQGDHSAGRSDWTRIKRASDDIISACNPNDTTYSSESMPAGSYMDWGLLDTASLTSGKQYITIVNLTPHRFKLQSTHSYQMDVFDWGDVPPGRARQNLAQYTTAAGKDAVDDNGEAYYSIEGTSKQFVIRATTHIPDTHWRRTVIDLSGMGLGQREYSDPAAETSVTLVITGSESYGFITSLTYGAVNWMKEIYDVIKDRPLQHIVIPGTHDSGMSTISDKIVSLGTTPNTQTQALSIYNQLRVGARWFDLRLMSVHQLDTSDYEFYAAHVNDETADVPVGNTGESLSDIIQEINQFTSENPGEVIFFHLRYLIGIRNIPSGPIYWGNDTVDAFFTQLEKINNRCGNLDTDVHFQHQKTSYFMGQNDGSGCVIFLLDGSNLKTGVTSSSVSDGFYPAGQMGIDDHWSDLANTQPMAENQISVWSGIERVKPFSNDEFLISQWLVSADVVTTTALTIQNIAILPTNPALYWAGVNAMSPQKWPNVLLVDYIGVVVTDQFAWSQLGAELYTLAIGLNLYMISENCDVSDERSPVLPSLTSSTSSQTKRAASGWNGIIYANGTVVDHPPRNLHPGRVEVLKAGTVFNNGTVLEQDIRNPNFNSTAF
ncbi:hypothetical protein AOCH_000070 [Aspergillus ochraceoroseus]|uniref:Phosphatidylinositol-specific phospholipase C X domain-containing protein n=2 Tax=Aspergillus ochraceoroseus TaxID=138278 RepID=A0A0F8W3Q8_9EURO|nr:hypothetical protein AOCH_000070 [Aspergillus ochraceoroseus]